MPGNPNEFKQVASSRIRQASDVASNSFFTFELGEPVTLRPGTLYGFQILLAGPQAKFGDTSTELRISEDSFHGGQVFTSSKSDHDLREKVVFSSGDLVFHLKID